LYEYSPCCHLFCIFKHSKLFTNPIIFLIKKARKNPQQCFTPCARTKHNIRDMIKSGPRGHLEHASIYIAIQKELERILPTRRSKTFGFWVCRGLKMRAVLGLLLLISVAVSLVGANECNSMMTCGTCIGTGKCVWCNNVSVSNFYFNGRQEQFEILTQHTKLQLEIF